MKKRHTKTARVLRDLIKVHDLLSNLQEIMDNLASSHIHVAPPFCKAKVGTQMKELRLRKKAADDLFDVFHEFYWGIKGVDDDILFGLETKVRK